MPGPDSIKGDFWTEASAVRRYRDARPYFHPVVMQMIRRRLQLSNGEKLEHGIDVGCGTGQSTVALLDIAQAVTGIDNSEQMLAHALQVTGASYVVGSAEQMAVEDNSADIVTASLAVHWFDLPLFLSETARVLKPGGWVVLYSNNFRAQMIGNPEFRQWCYEQYAVRYPTPPRRAYDPSPETFTDSRLEWIDSEDYENRVEFTHAQLVAYLMTQSNVIAAVEQGDETAEDVYDWLSEQTAPLFRGEVETFQFGGNVIYARLP